MKVYSPSLALLMLAFLVAPSVWGQGPLKTREAATREFREFDAKGLDRVLSTSGPQRVRVDARLLKRGNEDAATLFEVGNRQLAIPRVTGERFDRIPAGIPVEIELERRDDEVVARDFDVKALKDWEQAKRSLPASKFGKLHDDFEDLRQHFDKLKSGRAMGDDDLQKKIETTKRDTTEGYFAPRTNNRERELLCDQFANLLEMEAGIKATHGRDDNYTPQVYRKIFNNSGSVVGIALAGRNRTIASGVLIGDDLVLTCRHTFEIYNKKPEDCVVWFEHDDDQGNASRLIFPGGKIVAQGQAIPDRLDKPLDFVLFEIGKNEALNQKASEMTIGDVGQQRPRFPKASLQPRLLIRDESVYVVGYPEQVQEKIVHDNAFVLFPFQVNTTQFEQLHLQVCAEYKNAKKRGEVSERVQKIYNTFLASYRQAGNGQFELYSATLQNFPLLLVDCDTSKGDSGGGAFDRRNGGLIGILYGGSYAQHRVSSGWRYHEGVIPISLILDQINDQLEPDPGQEEWWQTYNVEIE